MIPRYARPQMTSIWEPEARFRIWFEIEAHALDAMAELGVVPREAAQAVWDRLQQLGQRDPPLFSLEMVAELPAAARRYFARAIAPGTPLRMVVELEMAGEIGLGTKDNPGYRPMRAREIIAPPHGFVWSPTIGTGLARITGSDGYAEGEGWTRFWLGGIIPIARPRPSPDLARSAAARSILEALWAPASLLPLNGVVWEDIDPDRARAVFRTPNGDGLALTIAVAHDGSPMSVMMQRWTNANPDRVFRWQPTGGFVEELGTVDGYTVPTRMSAGNQFRTDRYFPFFKAQIASMVFH